MTSQTQSYTYAASSDTRFTFSPVVVTETVTVPASDFSGVSTFLPTAPLTPAPPQLAGPTPLAPSYDGLTWTPFSVGSFAPGDSVVVTFSYTVTSNIVTEGISSVYQAMNFDYVAGGSYVTGTAVTTLTNNGNIVGQSTASINSPSVGNIALSGAYSSVNVTVTMTLAVAANAPVGAAVAASKLAEGYNTTTIVPGPGSIGDFVWNDLNGDGIFGAGEAAMSGVTVDLLNASGTVVAVTTTDATGHYLFSGVNPGSYQVAFVAPFGYSFTSQVAGNGAQTVSAANVSTGRTALFTLGSGQNIAVEDAGLVFGASGGGGSGGVGAITTHVYFDTDGDSTQDVGETNLAGVTVSLLNGSGVPTGQTAVTDSNGNVSFTGLAPGSYQVSITTPAGDTVTEHTNVGAPIAVVANQTVAAVEGLTILPATFTTHVYFDADADSIQEPTEGALAGVTLALLNGSGVPTGRTGITDANGNVSFTGLVPGTYQVAVTTPAGDVVTQQYNVATPVTLAPGQTVVALEGLYLPAKFNTHVYLDNNGDSSQGVGETNLAGVTVALLNGSGVATGQTAVTDTAGNVSFLGLAPGGYQVAVTTPSGTVVSQNTNTRTTNTLLAGQTANAIEGVYTPATFNTRVYLDTNGDSTQGGGEAGFAGVTVVLKNVVTGATVGTTTTDASGNVSFAGLPPGQYQVAVSTPSGYGTTQLTNVGTPTTLASGQTVTAIEGLKPSTGTATFTTHVYYDTNKDGVQGGTSETNLAGVTVTLLTGTGASTGKTAITNAAGNVSFTGLTPGSYEVAVTAPNGTVVTKAVNVGTPNTLAAGGSATAIEGVVAGAPGISVDKTASVTAVKAVDGNSCDTYFSTVTYTYKVTNTGNTAVNNIKLVDNHGTSLLPNNMTPVSVLASCSQYNVGDANRNGVLDVGESWSYQAKIIETGNYVGNPSVSASTSISGCATGGGETIWLSSVLKSYQNTDGTSYAFKGVTANVRLANGTTQSYSVPDSYVTFSSSCTSPTTTWDAVQHAWITTLKAGSNPGNVFMTGVPITVPAGTNMNGATVTMSVNTAVSSNGATAPSWAISTSAYDNFKTSTGDDASHDYSKIGVKACDYGDSSYRGNSSYDKAGTSGACQDNHGGSNYKAEYGWNYSNNCYSGGTYSYGCTGYTYCGSGSSNTGSTGYSAMTTMRMTALADSTSIDNVTVSAQTVCSTGYGGGGYTGSYCDDGYRGGYYGNGGDGDDGRYRNGSDDREDGDEYSNRSGCYTGKSYSDGYKKDKSRSYDDDYSRNSSYDNNSYSGGDYKNCNSYSSSYGSYGDRTELVSNDRYESSSSSSSDVSWDSARSCWSDDRSASTGYFGSGIDDREVTGGKDDDGRQDDYSKTCGTSGGTTPTPSGCVVTTVTASDMQNVQILATNKIKLGGTAPTAELKTAYGAATKLEFSYSPSDVVSAAALQNGASAANGHNTDSLAFIEVTNNVNPFAADAKVYFAGTVATGAKFIADATTDINNNLIPGGAFSTIAGQNLYAFVFADQATFRAGAAATQTIIYDTTGGNGGMNINDQIGSIKLVGYVGTSGYGYLAA